jgi:fucose 4-O-acetylase-like acetyltransferase
MNNRIEFLDTAKAIGMLLVFQGHLISRYIQKGIGSFDLQMSLIYSFHMPFFFFISGFFFKSSDELHLLSAIKRLISKRIVPVIFFNIIGLVAFLIVSTLTDKPIYTSLLNGGMNLLKGRPSFNYLTWFLICLFSLEVINLLQHKFIGAKSVYISIPLFSILGYLASIYLSYEHNIWFILSAFTAIVFYQLGNLFFKHLYQYIYSLKVTNVIFYIMICTTIWIIATILNIPYLKKQSDGIQVVLINILNLGNILFFYAAAFSGLFVLLLISKLLPIYQKITFLGSNSLILLGLQGIIHHYINPYLLVFNVQNQIMLFIFTWLISLITYLLCYPFINPINVFFRYADRKLN